MRISEVASVNPMFAEFDAILAGAFEVPCKSALIPAEFHHEKLPVKLGSFPKGSVKQESEAVKEKRIKAANIQKYIEQAEKELELVFNVDERRLNEAEIRFCKHMVAVGIMTEEDFE